MTPEQLNWDDKQWAAHLGCAVQDVPKFKKTLEKNFWLALWQERETGLKYAEIQRRHDTPSGCIRYVPFVTSKAFDVSLEDLVEYTNNKFLPNLVLKPAAAEMLGVPRKILQMLHIQKEK
jgi:hypothetical protein